MAGKVSGWSGVACARCKGCCERDPHRRRPHRHGCCHRCRRHHRLGPRHPSAPPGLHSPVPAQEEAQPRRYRALLCERLGDPQEALGRPHSALALAALPAAPLPHPSAVRIRVAAAALNFADALQLQARRAGRSAVMHRYIDGEHFAHLLRGASQASFGLMTRQMGPQDSANSGPRRCPTPALPPAGAVPGEAQAALHAAPIAWYCLQGRYQEKPKLPVMPPPLPGTACRGGTRRSPSCPSRPVPSARARWWKWGGTCAQ